MRLQAHETTTTIRSAVPAFDGIWRRPEPASPPALDAAAFREALGHFATGVTVVTAGTADGRLAGLTANSFASVSLDPPLVLVCIKRDSRSVEVLREAGRFAVHILTAEQKQVALAFARRGADKLQDMAWRMSGHGIPVLDRHLVRLDCDLACEYEGGDHLIFLGRVLGIDWGRAEPGPLTFFRGELGALSHAGP